MMDEEAQIKARITACAQQSMMNAKTMRGDVATASADLLCAFVLLSVKSNLPPDKALEAMWDHAKAVVADFWPDQRKH